METSVRDIKLEATKNILDFKYILDKLKIPFWLDGGTLLGAYRDKDFCKDDEDDIDLCTWMEYMNPEIIKEAEAMGFEIFHCWATQFAFKRNGSKIDLFFNMKKGDNAYTFLYAGEEKIPVVIPLHFYENLAPIEFKGANFWRPKEIEEYLTLKYGDWKTPVHRSEYLCYRPEDNKVVQKDFNYD